MVAHHHRGDKVSGDYQHSLLGAAFDCDDPIDTFCLSCVTIGRRWFQRRSISEVAKLYAQQKCMAAPEERQQVILERDRLVMDDSAYNIIK